MGDQLALTEVMLHPSGLTAPDDEALYEKLIVNRAEELGWQAFKVQKLPVKRKGGGMVWMTGMKPKGWPDRTLTHPLGYILFLEVKGKRGALKPEQKVLIKDLQATMEALDSPRFQAYACWPKDWPAVERMLLRPHTDANGVSVIDTPTTEENQPCQTITRNTSTGRPSPPAPSS